MDKNVNIWAVRLNASVVELRSASGPVKIVRSCYHKITLVKQWDYNTYPPKSKDVKKVVKFHQTYFQGGKLLGRTTPAKLSGQLGSVSFAKDDVVKLSETQKTVVLNPIWRKNNL